MAASGYPEALRNVAKRLIQRPSLLMPDPENWRTLTRASDVVLYTGTDVFELAYLRRRLLSMTPVVAGFAVSSLESLREGGGLTDTQARRLDSGFTPNGRGIDLEAPLRWCLGKSGALWP
ncbi:MAG: hypothetical protein LBK59_07970 [Bifidobacteriaceae bacterium]|jgi:hypothetical protein|nr:hypothetical protein [Bifidobacteriaceae bacterium]